MPNVIVPENFSNPPEQHEIDAAWIIARHYNTTIEFLRPVDDYHRTTPDMLMNGQLWELKSPIGKSKQNIERQIKRAVKQSRNVIIDGSRSKATDGMIERKLRYETSRHKSVRKLIFIDKEKKVVEIVWR